MLTIEIPAPPLTSIRPHPQLDSLGIYEMSSSAEPDLATLQSSIPREEEQGEEQDNGVLYYAISAYNAEEPNQVDGGVLKHALNEYPEIHYSHQWC